MTQIPQMKDLWMCSTEGLGLICVIYLNPDGPRSIFLLFSLIFTDTKVVVGSRFRMERGQPFWAKKGVPEKSQSDSSQATGMVRPWVIPRGLPPGYSIMSHRVNARKSFVRPVRGRVGCHAASQGHARIIYARRSPPKASHLSKGRYVRRPVLAAGSGAPQARSDGHSGAGSGPGQTELE